eukprot:216755-Chlamydomonas_euryale.AAC.2
MQAYGGIGAAATGGSPSTACSRAAATGGSPSTACSLPSHSACTGLACSALGTADASAAATGSTAGFAAACTSSVAATSAAGSTSAAAAGAAAACAAAAAAVAAIAAATADVADAAGSPTGTSDSAGAAGGAAAITGWPSAGAADGPSTCGAAMCSTDAGALEGASPGCPASSAACCPPKVTVYTDRNPNSLVRFIFSGTRPSSSTSPCGGQHAAQQGSNLLAPRTTSHAMYVTPCERRWERAARAMPNV